MIVQTPLPRMTSGRLPSTSLVGRGSRRLWRLRATVVATEFRAVLKSRNSASSWSQMPTMWTRRLRSVGQSLRQCFASPSVLMPSASMMIRAAPPPSSQLIACLRRLVILHPAGSIIPRPKEEGRYAAALSLGRTPGKAARSASGSKRPKNAEASQ